MKPCERMPKCLKRKMERGEKARPAGVKTGPILEEIAELSSDVNKYGMGSTRSLLLSSVLKESG